MLHSLPKSQFEHLPCFTPIKGENRIHGIGEEIPVILSVLYSMYLFVNWYPSGTSLFAEHVDLSGDDLCFAAFVEEGHAL